MAVPKRKTTPSKRNMRRSHDRVQNFNLVECTNCGELKLAHQICNACGYYNKKEVVKKIELESEEDQDS